MFEKKKMEIKTFYFNPIRECCYVAWDATGECVFIDPGCHGEREFQRLKDFVAQRGLKPVKILLTHGHFDHLLGLEDVASAWHIDAWLHPLDRGQMIQSIAWSEELGLPCKPFTGVLHDLADGDKITFGETTLEVIFTPGHTEGGVCFFCRADGVLFSGDTLFAGSIGRTDRPGGDYDRIIESISSKLMTLDGDVQVLPGHGPATSIGYERATNPFLNHA